MKMFGNGKLQFCLALGCAVLFSVPSLAGAYSVDAVLATNGTSGIADDFGDGVLDPAWTVLSGSPVEDSGLLRIANGDTVVRSTGLLAPAALVTAQFSLAELVAGEFGGLMLFGADSTDVFTINLTTAGVFVADESGVLGAAPIVPGLAATVQVVAAANDIVVGVNGTPAYAGTSGLSAFPTGLGFYLVPEPTAAVLALAGLLFARRR